MAALLTIAVLLELVADILFKQWAMKNHILLILGGVFVYGVSTVLWAFSLKYELLSKAIVVFTLGNLVLGVLAGLIIFSEELTIVQKVGVALGVISIIMVEI